MLQSDGLQRVPFTFLDVESSKKWACVSASSQLPIDRTNTLPGLVSESDDIHPSNQSAVSYTRQFSSGLTAEIAIQVLSVSHYTSRYLRIVFGYGRRPSRLELFVAPSKCIGALARSRKKDPISRYLDASFERACEDFTWPPQSMLSEVQTEAIVPFVSFMDKDESRRVEFIKIVLHRPPATATNLHQEVTIKELELTGVFNLPSRLIYPLDNASSIRDDNLDNIKVKYCRGSEIPMSSVHQHSIVDDEMWSVSTYPQRRASPPTQQVGRDYRKTSFEDLAYNRDHHLDSPFDVAIREFVENKNQQDKWFCSIGVIQEQQHFSNPPEARCQPRISNGDPRRFEAIAIHTFGSFFTRCVLLSNGENDQPIDVSVSVECLRLVERLSPFLVDAGMPIELAYEGLLAVVVLTLRSPSTVPIAVFNAALALVRTTFQERERAFRIVGEVSIGAINVGLQLILDHLLAAPHCWSLGQKTTPNRAFLKTIRLLMLQPKTSSSLIRAVLLPDQTYDMVTTPNRLRTQRWLLQRHHHNISSSQREEIRVFCNSLLENARVDSKVIKVVQECLTLLRSPYSASRRLDAQLATIKRLLEDQDKDEREIELHVPLFDVYPLSQQQRESFICSLRKYLKLHERPIGLYYQEFTPWSLEGHAGGEYRKGNVVFKGHFEERVLPTLSFHNELERKAKPFHFHITAIPEPSIPTTLETQYARFNGTVEARRSKHAVAAKETTSQPQLGFSTGLVAPRVNVEKLSSMNDIHVMPVDEAQAEPLSNKSEPPSVSTSKLMVANERRVSTAVVPTDTVPMSTPVTSNTLVQPKTAPSGKGRVGASQDPGCVIQ